jgi:hypothetical protein
MALSDELEWFFVAALKGKMHEYAKEEQFSPTGSQETPISSGLSEGFSPQDIAHFYLTREIGPDWQERLVDNLSEDFRKKVETAHIEFQKDSQQEVNYCRRSLQETEGT